MYLRNGVLSSSVARTYPSDKRHRLDAGDVEALSASQVFARRPFIQQHHVTLPPSGIWRGHDHRRRWNPVLLLADHPPQVVGFGAVAETDSSRLPALVAGASL